MGITRAAWNEADKLNERGRALADAGDWDAALSCYRRAVERVPSFEPAWFNMALVHKRRRHWTDALDCNQRAASLGGEQGDPAWWNLGIAATALRRWDVARTAWQRFEVVWGQRIDPARIVVKNVPLPQSGHRWGDIVLHDGAPNGERRIGDRVLGVFDEIERWQPSAIPTPGGERQHGGGSRLTGADGHLRSSRIRGPGLE